MVGVRCLWLAPLIPFMLSSATQAQRVSPKNGFFSVETPKGWNQPLGSDTLIWQGPSANTQIVVSLLDEHGSFSGFIQLMKSKGIQVTDSQEITFHGVRCVQVSGVYSSFDWKTQNYYCLARRGTDRRSVFLSFTVDSNAEPLYAPTRDAFFEGFRWDNDVTDDH